MAKTAVEAPRTNAWLFDPEHLRLVMDEKHPLYDPRVHLPTDEAMIRNIMVNGVIEPVIIAKEGQDVVVVDGRQRTKNAIEANKRLTAEGKEPVKVTCIIRRGDDASLFGVLISANENRQDDTPLGKADKLSRYLAMGRTEEQAAIAFGVSTVTIKTWLVMLTLSDKVKQAVDGGVISATAAVKLADLPRPEQETALNSLIESGGRTSGRNVEKVKNGNRPSLAKMKSRKAVELKLAEEGLHTEFIAALKWVLGLR
jgi:ParB family chromosome partitioning protein